MVKADVVQLDSGVTEKFYELMTNQGSLDLRFPSMTTDTTMLNGEVSTTLSMSRTLASIRAVWVTFYAAGKSDLKYVAEQSAFWNNRHASEANSFHTPKAEQRGGSNPFGTYALSTTILTFRLS